MQITEDQLATALRTLGINRDDASTGPAGLELRFDSERDVHAFWTKLPRTALPPTDVERLLDEVVVDDDGDDVTMLFPSIQVSGARAATNGAAAPQVDLVELKRQVDALAELAFRRLGVRI